MKAKNAKDAPVVVNMAPICGKTMIKFRSSSLVDSIGRKRSDHTRYPVVKGGIVRTPRHTCCHLRAVCWSSTPMQLSSMASVPLTGYCIPG